MNSVDQHIQELLFDHDCVIVPALGGFLASAEPSKIDLTRHLIYPPCRKIAFNVYLKQNDGLLANHMAVSEQLTYHDALSTIEKFVNHCLDDLDKGNKVTLEELGTLEYDKERNLQFNPSRNANYLKDTYGLSPIQLINVQPDIVENSDEERKKIASKIRPSIPLPEKRTSPSAIFKNKYIGMVAVAGAFLWFSINLYLVAPYALYKSSLNPFEREVPLTIKTKTVPPIEEQSITNIQPEVAVPVTANPELVEPKAEISENSTSIPETIPATVQKTAITSFSVPGFYIIAGVFRVPANATTFLQSLKDSGFSNAAIIQTGDLHYVCFDAFPKRHDALTFLDSLKENKREAWILHN